MAKKNNGAPGIDGVTFEAIEAQGAEQFLEQIRSELVSAGLILTHCAEVKVTPLGEDDGLCGAVDVDPGASSGDTSDGPTRGDASDRAGTGLFAQHGSALSARRRCEALRAEGAARDRRARLRRRHHAVEAVVGAVSSCEGPIGCMCSSGLSLRDWEVPPNRSTQGAQPNEHPQECPTHVCPSTRNGS